MALPTPDDLRSVLDYDPDTGVLTWVVSRGSAISGDEAGCVYRDSGYRYVRFCRTGIPAHRVVWAIVHGEWPEEEIDHINGDRSDNRIRNLRAVNSAGNARNKKKTVKNTSGVVGVEWYSRDRKWIAKVGIDRKQVCLGKFDSFDDAVAARIEAAARLGYHPNHGRSK